MSYPSLAPAPPPKVRGSEERARWDWDLASDKVEWDAGLAAFLGYRETRTVQITPGKVSSISVTS